MGFVQFAKPIDAEALIQKALGKIKQMEDQHAAFVRIVEALRKFEGKTVTKRIETALKAALPDLGIRFTSIASMEHVECNAGRFLLRYTDSYSRGDGCYHEALFVGKYNTGTANIPEWLAKHRAGVPMIGALAARYNDLLAAAKSLVKDSEAYGLEFEFDIASNCK